MISINLLFLFFIIINSRNIIYCGSSSIYYCFSSSIVVVVAVAS
jgi:hypothetical protein